MELISGFSKLTKEEKISWLALQYPKKNLDQTLNNFLHQDKNIQKNLDEFSENTISNFYLPYGIIPNFILNGKNHAIPMVTEESSVVAASCKAAKFWSDKGGFHTEMVNNLKAGHVHFYWQGDWERLQSFFADQKQQLEKTLEPILKNMVKRGGGLSNLYLKNLSDKEPGFFQIFLELNTCDAMGANIINTCLEAIAKKWQQIISSAQDLSESERHIQIIMAIVSNYTPNCLVRAWVESPIAELGERPYGHAPKEFAEKFYRAVRVAQIDTFRATTHNKGIMNGVDAVIIATGNDFRAIEAGAHTYAAKDGHYQSLSSCEIKDNIFRFTLEMPIALGTVGGITSLHPMAKTSLDILENPSADELAQIACSVGLAQNFAALSSLVTSGIQKGHMKMHLKNILIQEQATTQEVSESVEYFNDKTISYGAVKNFLQLIRAKH